MRVLIAYSQAANGHRTAAEAIYTYFRENTAYDISMVNCLDFSSPFIRQSYPGVYHFLVKRLPWLWSLLYNLTAIRPVFTIFKPIRAIFDMLTIGQFRKFLIDNDFDAIISTHFRPASAAAKLKNQKLIHSKLISVVTDFDFHRIWKAVGTDAYAVAHGYTKRRAIENGIKRKSIYITGLPTHRRFEEPFDKTELLKKLGLPEHSLTLLIVMGSLGTGPLVRLFKALKQYNLIILCGQNTCAKNKIDKHKLDNVRTFSKAEKIEELMGAADLIITKPSRQITSEALVMGILPVFFAPGPGQEQHNIKILDEYHIGSHKTTIKELTHFIRSIEEDNQLLKSLTENLKSLKRSDAANKIQHILEDLCIEKANHIGKQAN